MSTVNSNKVLGIILITVILAGLVSHSSFAQNYVAQDAQKSQIYLQIQIRSSDGQLVAYIEPTVLYVYYPDLFKKYIETKADKSITTVEGKKYEKIQFEETGTFDKTHTMAQYVMWDSINGRNIGLLALVHDGYPEIPGDKIIASWTILEPVSD